MADAEKLLKRVIGSGGGFVPNEVVNEWGDTVAIRGEGDSLLEMLNQAALKTKGEEAFLIEVGGDLSDVKDDNIIW